MTISIIIPVFNEEKTIEEIIGRVVAADTLSYKKEIIAVNDGSTDASPELLEKLEKLFGIILLQHAENLGKGAAIRTGLNKASGDLVLIQDGDLEYDPKDYPKLLKAINRDASVIYGSRNIFPQKTSHLHYVWGANFLTWLANRLFGSQLTDLYTGYKLFPSSLIKSIALESRGFEFEAEITAKILKKGIAIREVPITYSPRTFEEGKKIRFRDGLVGLLVIGKNWLK